MRPWWEPDRRPGRERSEARVTQSEARVTMTEARRRCLRSASLHGWFRVLPGVAVDDRIFVGKIAAKRLTHVTRQVIALRVRRKCAVLHVLAIALDGGAEERRSVGVTADE